MSVTMPRRGDLVWGQQPDWDAESMWHDSGSSSHMLTNSKLMIRWMSFGGTDEKPGRWASWGIVPAPASTRGPVVEVAGSGALLPRCARAATAKVSKPSVDATEKTGSVAVWRPDGPATGGGGRDRKEGY